MAKEVSQKVAVKRLKKQANLLLQKEKLARQKLHAALVKVSKIVRAYETKLIKKTQDTKAKVAAAEAAVYAKLAKSIQKKAKQAKLGKKSKKVGTKSRLAKKRA